MLLRSSIRRILFVIVLLVILPALSIIVYSGTDTRKRAITALSERSADILNTLGGLCRIQAESTRALLRILSRHEALRDKDVAAAKTLFSQIVRSRSDLFNICLVDLEGRILTSALPLRDEQVLVKIPPPYAGRAGDFFSGGDFLREPKSGRSFLSYSLFVPHSASSLPGVFLVVWLKTEKVLSLDERDLSKHEGVLHIRSSRGELVYVFPAEHNPAYRDYERTAWETIRGGADDQGELTLKDGAGRKYIVSYERVRLSGDSGPAITLELSMPKKVAYAEGNAAFIRNILLLGLAAFAALCVAYFMGSRVLVRPIRSLVSTARRIAGGDLHARASLTVRQGELGRLAASFDEMAAALEARNRELVNAKNTADTASKAKGEFLSNMSHEIRTPMNGVIGMAYLALKSGLSPKQQTYVAKIFAAANTLLRIINDILDFSKIESGQLDIEYAEFNLDDILDNIAVLVSQKAEEKGIEVLFGVDSNVPTSLVGDALRLGQVLTNLLNNAVKFTSKGEIIVSCTLDSQREPLESGQEQRVRLRFMVKDTGIGMTQEQQSRLFSAFTQADGSITRRFGGTGLGLIITKRLIELMNGGIQVLSEQGKGTTVIFTASFGLPESGTKEGAHKGNQARVLVVDDNEPAARMMRNILQSMHFRADCAASPAEAFAMLWQADGDDPYRVVLMDWRLPGMDGVEATWRLRTELNLNHVPPVFICTALSRSEVLQQAEKAGAVGVIFKPVNKTILFESVTEALLGRTPGPPRPPHTVTSLHERRHPAFPGAQVLVVEDNPINQEVAKELLEDAGVEVTAVNNGLEALKAVEASDRIPPFDLVILDLRMPEMDGYETARRLRADPRNSSMPIVAMTAHVMAEERRRCLDAGMNDHISKPIEVDKFFAALSRWMPAYGKEERLVEKERSKMELVENTTVKRRAPSVKEGAIFLPGIESDTALSRLGNNERLYVKLLKQFLSYYGNTESQFRAAFDAGDLVEAQRMAHTLKGLAGSIGAAGLARESARLEASFNDSAKEEISMIAVGCFEELARVQEILREAFALEDAAAAAAPGTDRGQPLLTVEQKTRKNVLLEQLAAFLREDDAEATVFFSNNGPELTRLLSADSFSRLQSMISRFQFEEALEWMRSAESLPERGQ